VRLPAKLTLSSPMLLPTWGCLAGRSALPLEPGHGGRRGMPRGHQGQASGANEAGPARSGCRAGSAQEPAWLVGACGWGSGMPPPPGQIPPPWAWWENEAPTARAARRPVLGLSRSGGGLVAEDNEGIEVAETPVEG
jgi:hypothetical protein